MDLDRSTLGGRECCGPVWTVRGKIFARDFTQTDAFRFDFGQFSRTCLGPRGGWRRNCRRQQPPTERRQLSSSVRRKASRAWRVARNVTCNQCSGSQSRRPCASAGMRRKARLKAIGLDPRSGVARDLRDQARCRGPGSRSNRRIRTADEVLGFIVDRLRRLAAIRRRSLVRRGRGLMSQHREAFSESPALI
jgi:hypothetical protein